LPEAIGTIKLPDRQINGSSYRHLRRGNLRIWSGRRGSNSQLSAWESEFSILYFHNLQNRLREINVHALHTVHALPDLRVAGGRLGDDFDLPLGRLGEPILVILRHLS
jgi:hypothetical protein